MSKNVFVLGLDEDNHEILRALPGAEGYRFHPLLAFEELTQGELDMPALLAEAERQLDSFDGPVDAIIGYWDFPVSSLVPLLCEPRGLPHAPLEAIVRCEHKYWSRLEQRAVVPEVVPRFAEVDLEDPRLPEGLSYPLWLKPVKAFSSVLAFRVTDDDQYRNAVQEVRQGAGRVGEPFQWVMDQVQLPREVAEAGGTAGLAEEEGRGRQLTVEGYVRGSEPHVYGIIDSDCYPGTSSFLCYEYPSRQPESVRERLVDLSERVISRMGLDDTAFNIEYFYDPSEDKIILLEVNPRHAQSHAMLFENVNGLANHETALSIALGEEPSLGSGGKYAFAVRWFLRRFRDGFVHSVPSEEEIARVQRQHPGTRIEIVAQPDKWLSELPGQDSYSFELADIFVGARNPEEAERKYRECVDALHFDIRDAEQH